MTKRKKQSNEVFVTAMRDARKKSGARKPRSIENLVLVFGDQLDHESPLIRDADPKGDAILFMEVAEESTHIPVHKQRTTLFLSAMRHFALDLLSSGCYVRYVAMDDPENTQSFESEMRRAIEELQPRAIRAMRPGEHRVHALLASVMDEFDGEYEIVEDPHFLITPSEFSEWAEGRKEFVLEHFYRMMRKRFDVLMEDDGQPAGGEWNFDKRNREPFDGDVANLPNPRRHRPDDITQEVMALVEDRFADNPGSLEAFEWPVTRNEAKRALRHFIQRRLPNFGPYQDAMRTGAPWMYHSLISPAINLHLLNPRECIEAAVQAFESGDAPINSVEGFIRQLLGWREFIRGVYWHEGAVYGTRNSFGQDGNLPDFYWWNDEDHQMNCMRECIGEVIDHGYGHHIQRLMVTGNFALIAGVSPQAISDWYLAMYVDAVDWVTRPNTLGMVMHADGGVVGTKPYAASGKYINRMSDYCKGCQYNPAKRTGDDACPFTTFYWDFLLRNEKTLRTNNRMRMVLSNLNRMSDDEKREIRDLGTSLREQFGIES